MLVITRKETETVLIGDVEIIIDKVSGKKVKIRIAAKPEIKVLRGELKPREAA